MHFCRAGYRFFEEFGISALDNRFETLKCFVVFFLAKGDASQIIVRIRTESAFGEGLQIVDQAAACFFVVATVEEFLGGNIGKRILFADFQTDISTQ